MKKQKQTDFNQKRRTFIKSTAITAAGFTIVPRHVLGGKNYIAPSDRINVGLVGAGGRGQRNAYALLQLDDVRVSCIADPAEYWNLANFYYKSEAGSGPVKTMIEKFYKEKGRDEKVNIYKDFKEMLAEEKDLDAILCATPDHTHAYISVHSMLAKKHVYCEKPLTHNIWEARQVQKVAKETGMATQMGNQLHSSKGIRDSVEYLRAGAIGEVKEIFAWVPATRWLPGLKGLPKGTTPMPKNFDWDLWLGPREERPYHESYTPVNWRDFWDFGCGAMGDFGCHDMDASVWAFDLPAPETVELLPAGFSNAEITPYGEIGYFNFAAGENRSPIKLTWYAGGLRPEIHPMIPKGVNYPRRGALYVGEQGVMLYGNGKIQLFPQSLEKEFKVDNPTLAPTNGHHRDWIDAIKGGASASSNFEYAAKLTEITLLGVLSLRLGGKKIHWDAANMKAVGMPEADPFIKEAIRKGWEMEV